MKTFFALALALTLSACAGSGSINWNDARQLKAGMSEKEVVALMGRPYAIQVAGENDRWVWVYATAFGGVEKMTAELKDGRVVSVPRIPESFGR